MRLLLLVTWLIAGDSRSRVPCRGPASDTGQPIPYTQSISTRGVTIEAPAAVDSQAVTMAKSIVEHMLNGPKEFQQRLRQHDAALAIIPRGCYITALREFMTLAGKRDPNGNAYDSFAVRGAGAVPAQPTTATAEENLLHLPGDPFHGESIGHHEFAHAIMNLAFTDAERREWTGIYQAARAKGLFPGAFAMTSADEYWAELSQSYFGVNNEINGAQRIQAADPAAASFLGRVYGPVP